MKLHFTSGYHPEGDGQTERTNQTLEQYLRIYVNYQQDNWHTLLPLAEFTYNNTPSSTTGVSPFFLNHGRHPRMGVEPRRDATNESAAQFAERMQKAWVEAKAALEQTAKAMKAKYDVGRKPSRQYKVGDEVWLEGTNLTTTRPSKKLGDKRFGPFKILEKNGASSYKLQLPVIWKDVHPVFNESLLSPYTPPMAAHQRRPRPPPPTLVDGHVEHTVETILDSRRRGRGYQYLVQWKGFGREHDSWEPLDNLANAMEKVRDFVRSHPQAKVHPHLRARAVHFADTPTVTTPPRPVWKRDTFPPDFFDHVPEMLTTGIDYSIPGELETAQALRQSARSSGRKLFEWRRSS